ncbi:acetyltransferase [Psychromonas sp. CNPT3]|uniref:GNAT family N-acetyltransferase n=1 Tax=Psychromonas sp. CNPT3 TaxID=314282 RepID=UPI00006E429D|nr:GNAT family N-acetyltransferase [Psychromonas sp. CNPT3]AGH80895.1 acetyltransferase [Psychromonas sp. CNPT3]
MNIKIRQIEDKDIRGFYDALCRVANEGIYLLTHQAPAYEKMQRFVRENIANNHSQYVAVLNEQIIGWADIIPLTRETMHHVGHLGMGVTLDFRGQGVGSALLEKSIAHAWKQNLKRLELEVFSDNEIAINLYKKYGFKIEGVKKQARLFKNKYQDITLMAQCQL